MLSLDYIAGIVDGEGHIGLHWSDQFGTLAIVCRVEMVNPIVVLQLHQQYGGHIFTVTRKKNKNARYTTAWTVKSSKAYVFLNDIKDKLLVKQKQAEVVLTYYELLKQEGGLDSDTKLCFKNMIHKLNKTGVNLQLIKEVG